MKERCVPLDPDGRSLAPEVLKAVVRANQNNAGIYGNIPDGTCTLVHDAKLLLMMEQGESRSEPQTPQLHNPPSKRGLYPKQMRSSISRKGLGRSGEDHGQHASNGGPGGGR